jgi:formylglycine-generating enzyme required for sulfatase activity
MQSPEGEDLSSNFSEIIDPGILGYDGITPSNINWSSYQGMGKIYISEGYSNQSYSAKSARHALIRGGFWNDYYSSGIYALNTKYAPEYHNPTTAIGFRCVYNPL